MDANARRSGGHFVHCSIASRLVSILSRLVSRQMWRFIVCSLSKWAGFEDLASRLRRCDFCSISRLMPSVLCAFRRSWSSLVTLRQKWLLFVLLLVCRVGFKRLLSTRCGYCLSTWFFSCSLYSVIFEDELPCIGQDIVAYCEVFLWDAGLCFKSSRVQNVNATNFRSVWSFQSALWYKIPSSFSDWRLRSSDRLKSFPLHFWRSCREWLPYFVDATIIRPVQSCPLSKVNQLCGTWLPCSPLSCPLPERYLLTTSIGPSGHLTQGYCWYFTCWLKKQEPVRPQM